MKRLSLFFASTLQLFWLAGSVYGQRELRTWTIKEGSVSKTVNARIVGLSHGRFTLRGDSGADVVVPAAALLEDERQEALISVVGSGVVVVHSKDIFREAAGVGSGFVFHQTGLIFTNYHVVQGAGELDVEFRDGGRSPAQCLAVDRQNDVAVLKVDRLPENTHVLSLSAKRSPKVGDEVWAIGHPEELKNTVSWGDINALRTTADLPQQLRETVRFPAATRWIQTDAVITQGSSGGPLLDASGSVVGMNTFVTGNQLGFAIHIAHARSAYLEAKTATRPLDLPLAPAEHESALAWMSREVGPIVKAISEQSDQLTNAGLSELEQFERGAELRATGRKQLLEIMEREPSSWPAFQAAYFICTWLGDASPSGRDSHQRACQVLLEHHLGRKDISTLLKSMVDNGGDSSLEFCRQVMDKSSNREVQLLASASVGLLHIKSMAANPEMDLAALETSRSEVAQIAAGIERNFKDLDGGEQSKRLSQALRRQMSMMLVGQPAVEIDGVDVDGQKFKLSDYRGKVVLLDFFADWCPYCKRMYPVQRQLVLDYQDQSLVILGVNCDSQQVLSSLVEQDVVTWRCWAAGPSNSITEDWQVDGFPTTYLIDHNGIVRKRFSGEPTKEELVDSVELLLAEAASGAEALAEARKLAKKADAQHRLAMQLGSKGKFAAARREHEQVLNAREELAKEFPRQSRHVRLLTQSLNELAWLLATAPDVGVRDGKRAVDLATRACQLDQYKDPRIVDTLAAAYAEAGNFSAAVETAEKALRMIGATNDESLRASFTEALNNYKAEKPTRAPLE